MLRRGVKYARVKRATSIKSSHQILNVRETASIKGNNVLPLSILLTRNMYSEITLSYIHLAKENHPDYGGDVEQFKILNEAYKDMKKQYFIGRAIREVTLVTDPVDSDSDVGDVSILGRDNDLEEKSDWIDKKNKIWNLFGTV